MVISFRCFLSLVTLNLILNLACVVANPAKTTARVLVIQDRSVEDGYKVEIESNGEKRELQLTPLESVWSDVAQALHIKRNENGEKVFERMNIPKDLKVYHDQTRGSFLSIKDGKVNGILDSDYVISSEGENHFISSASNAQEIYKHDYKIVKEVPVRLYPTGEQIKINSTLNLRAGGSYTAEIAVIVDSRLRSAIGSNEKIYEYLTVFWNGVKKRFDTISSPKITIRLVGCTIIENSRDEPFISDNTVDNDYVLGDALEDGALWIHEHMGTLPPHDIIFIQTGKDMIDSGGSSGLAGIAYMGGACKKTGNYLVDNEVKKLSIAVAIGEDVNGKYRGVHTATHEIAHNLGSPHDDDDNDGTGNCPWEDGYIMSYEGGTINKLFFSQCSKDKMAEYLATSFATCTTQQISTTKPAGVFTSTKLPGQMMTMDEQCKAMTGYSDSTVYTNVESESELCYNLKCLFPKDGGYWVMWTSTGAGEGSRCPSGKHCNNGACV